MQINPISPQSVPQQMPERPQSKVDQNPAPSQQQQPTHMDSDGDNDNSHVDMKA